MYDAATHKQSNWLQGGRTYKELFGAVAKGGPLGRLAHLGRHVNVDQLRTHVLLRLLVELGLEGGEKGIARHRSAVGARGRGEGG